MILSAIDLVIEIDFGNDQPGAILQRKEKGHWKKPGHPFLILVLQRSAVFAMVSNGSLV